MKTFILVAWVAFSVLTFVGIGFVLWGGYNAGAAIVPMVFAVCFLQAYQTPTRHTP